MPASGSRKLSRYAAPAAFLLAATIVVLLVRAGLGGGGGGSNAPATISTKTVTHTHTATTVTTLPAVTAIQPATTASTATTSTTPGTTTVAGATYYTVQRGDTFSIIATKEGISVAEIETLNPGVSSNALQVGQQIRVK
jgi:LysM repeat protein